MADVEGDVSRALTRERDRGGDGRHPVTGLHTRTTMLQRLGEAIPEQSRGALYFVEIENTTALRDRFGYAALEGALVDTGRHVGELAGEHLVSRSEEHTSEIQSLMRISYDVLCLNKNTHRHTPAAHH